MCRFLSRSVLALFVIAMLGVFAAIPALAYGAENWQTGFAGTGVAPGTGMGFGFWGWCTFGGGVTSGNNGDCEFSQYFHAPAGSGATCQVSINVTSWTGAGGTFVISGTATVRPTTPACLASFPSSFTGADTGIPAMAGHFNFGTFGPLKGEFQVQVTQIP